MHPGNPIFLQPFAPVPPIHTLPAGFVPGVQVSVLRLDLVDQHVSGNKWYKLRYYLDEAITTGRGILTWGGAWSNHIIATAVACQRLGIPCAGIIRGEQPLTPSATLVAAEKAGMELFFISRTDYAAKKTPVNINVEKYLQVPEGGYGETGVRGAATILADAEATAFDHIYCAVGTGTTLAGLIRSAGPAQQVTGIAVVKDGSLEALVQSMTGIPAGPAITGNTFLSGLTDQVSQQVSASKPGWQLLTGFERGGYARHDRELVRFMNSFFLLTGIPTDFVYTAKLFMAVQTLLLQSAPAPEKRILIVHSGGLQGNKGLPYETLIF